MNIIPPGSGAVRKDSSPSEYMASYGLQQSFSVVSSSQGRVAPYKIEAHELDYKEEEDIHEHLLASDIENTSFGSPSFTEMQTNYSTDSKKEQANSKAGSNQGSSLQEVHKMVSSSNNGAIMLTSSKEGDHITQIKKHKAGDSLPGVGQICRTIGCDRVADGRTAYCKDHGGGRRCQLLGCLQSAQGGSEYCNAHKGRGTTEASGKQGSSISYVGEHKHEEGSNSADDSPMDSKAHSMFHSLTKVAHGGMNIGGRKRCLVAGCINNACASNLGRIGYCVRHGGGRRCRHEGCPKGAQGNTDFCIAHGGGKRCKYEGCAKSAQGKTDFCIKHGGGRRCQFHGCMKSARWGIDFCAPHGQALLGSPSSAPERITLSAPAGKSKSKAARIPETAIVVAESEPPRKKSRVAITPPQVMFSIPMNSATIAIKGEPGVRSRGVVRL